MKIAVHLDASGRPVSLYAEGVIHVFDGAGDNWSEIDAFAFALPRGTTSVSVVRGVVERARARLGDCRTLISGDRHGYIYSLLGQDLGVSCWTSEGEVAEQLAMVERRVRELAAAQQAAPACASAGCASGSCGGGGKPAACGPDPAAPPPEDLGGGKLRVDVAAVMHATPGLNSRQILLPVLEGGAFKELEVVCDHLPRWFQGTILQLGFEASYQTLPGVGVVATIARPTA